MSNQKEKGVFEKLGDKNSSDKLMKRRNFVISAA